MQDRGIAYEEINIEENPAAAALVMEHNQGRRRVPTFVIEERYYGNPPLCELERLLINPPHEGMVKTIRE